MHGTWLRCILLLLCLGWVSDSGAEDIDAHNRIDALLEQAGFPLSALQITQAEQVLSPLPDTVQIRLKALKLASSNLSYAEKQQQLADLATGLRQANNLQSYLDVLLVQAEHVYAQQDLAATASLLEIFNALLADEDKIVTRQRFAVFSIIGRLHQVAGNHELALEFLSKTAEEITQPTTPQGKFRRQFVRLHIARVLLRQQSYTLGEQMIKDTIAQSEADKLEQLLPELHLLLGYALQLQYGPTEEALNAFQIASKATADGRLGRVQMLALNNLGSVYFYREEYAKAKQYYLAGLQVAEALGSLFEQHVMLFNLGYIQVKTGDVSSGLVQMEVAYDVFSGLAALPSQISMLTYLADAYQAAGDTVKEAKTLRHILEKREQEIKNTRDNLIIEFQTKYEAEEQRLKIALLQHESDLKQIRLDKSAKDRFWFNLLILLLALALFCSLLVLRHVRHLNQLLGSANHKLEGLSVMDPLTNIHNRRALQHYTQQQDDVLLMLDIDYFKKINDQYGHSVGDKVLITVAERLTAILRKEDLLMRWGGEEFLLILRKVERSQLDNLVKKIVTAISAEPVENIQISVSGGLVIIPTAQAELEAQIKHADQLLYNAKAAGRGQIHSEFTVWPI